MGSQAIPEQDWKAFRELRTVALERFCQRVLDEVDSLRLSETDSYHQRYLDAYRLLEKRNEYMKYAFDNPRRSSMITQLTAIHAYGLLEPDELARFTPETRQRVEFLTNEEGGT